MAKDVRKASPLEVMKRANQAIKNMAPTLFKSMSDALPVPKDTKPKITSTMVDAPVQNQMPLGMSVELVNPTPLASPEPASTTTPELETPLAPPTVNSEIPYSDQMSQIRQPMQEPQLDRQDVAPKEKTVSFSDTVEQLKRADAQQQPNIREMQQSRPSKAVGPSPNAPMVSRPQRSKKQQRPAGQGQGKPQKLGNFKPITQDPSMSFDFGDLDIQDQSVMQHEDAADANEAYSEINTAIIERLVAHVSNLTSRLRMVEDIQNRVRMP